MSDRRRVVVTGIGIVSPLGLDASMTWKALIQGESGIHRIEHFDANILPCQIAGVVQKFKLGTFQTKHIHRMDLFVQYGIQAAREAIIASSIQSVNDDPTRIGVSIGSGMGGFHAIETQQIQLMKQEKLNTYYRSISPFFVPSVLMNMVSGLCAMEYGFQGPNFAVTSACATGIYNIGLGARMIQYGEADVMVVGGTEMASTPLSIAGFSASKALSTRNAVPRKASRPWDQSRDGFILSDGACVLVLEEYEHAKKRDANIEGEILGFGMSADAYHMTAPSSDGVGAVLAMKHALADANIEPERVDYINAHAASTPLGDKIEMKAIKNLWDTTTRSSLKISATKSMTGHLLGAAGALEAAFCLFALRDQMAPPTINLDNPDPICDGFNLVPHYAQNTKMTIALSNSFGFGGTNGSLLLGRI